MIKLENVTKKYGVDNNSVVALRNINLSIEKPGIVAIIGKSGSGKSTLLNIIGGLEEPSKGDIYTCGQQLNAMNEEDLTSLRRKKIGFIFQNYNLIPILNAYENIILPQIENDSHYVDDLMKDLGINNRHKHYPYELSGGQQQRVAIARALVNKPVVILADEPTGNLDSHNEKQVISLLKKIVKKNNSIILLVTHDIDVAKQADRIIKIVDGEVVADEENNCLHI